MDPASLTYRLVMQYSSSTDTIAQIAPIRWPGGCHNFVYRQMLAKLGSKYLEYKNYLVITTAPPEGRVTATPRWCRRRTGRCAGGWASCAPWRAPTSR